MASSDRSTGHAAKPAIIDRAKDQIRQFLLMFFYLWVQLTLFVLNDRIALNEHGLTLTFNGLALVNALVLAKVMLLMEDLHLSRWLDNRPLIYSIIYESALLSVMFLVFHVAERLAVGMWHGHTLEGSLPMIGGGGFSGVVSVALILFFSLLPFFAFKHLTRAVGAARVKALLFKAPGVTGE
ncbi:hypothetical protein [Aestuariivirga sp.]|uniref:hypothetical protein n=1 Tax=Aestuariivirga sp. TaxID=2650926 RepID=UPI003BA99343